MLDKIRSVISSIVNAIKRSFSSAAKKIGNFFKEIGNAIKNLFKGETSFKTQADGLIKVGVAAIAEYNGLNPQDLKLLNENGNQGKGNSDKGNSSNGKNNSNANGNNGNGSSNGKNGNNGKNSGDDNGSGKDQGNHNGNGNNGKHLGWYKKAQKPKLHGKSPNNTSDNGTYEVTNYINDVNQTNPQVLMTSDENGNYTSSYTYGIDRIAVNTLGINDEKYTPLYYQYDGRGDVTSLVNTADQTEAKYSYDAFGAPKPGVKLDTAANGFINSFGYNGESYDMEAGLQYLRARYYEPDTGRFLTRDSYLGNVMSPLTMNRYDYTINNPIMYNDASGNWPSWLDNIRSTVVSAVKTVAVKTYNAVSSAATGVYNFVTSAIQSIENIPRNISSKYNEYKTRAENTVRSAKSAAQSALNTIQPHVSSAQLRIQNIVKKIRVNVKKGCDGLSRIKTDAGRIINNVSYIADSSIKNPDKVIAGIGISLINNVAINIPNATGAVKRTEDPMIWNLENNNNNSAITAYQTGKAIGDIGSAVIGGLETYAGIGIGVGGVTAEVAGGPETEGLSWGAIPGTVAASKVLIVAGSVSIGTSLGNFGNDAKNTFDFAEKNSEGVSNPIEEGSLDSLPDNAQNMYNKYDKSGWKGSVSGQTPGTAAGSKYLNKDGLLPKVDADGNAITYKEFDVNNKLPDSTRDAQRFVRGSDGSVYYTDDHYTTFTKINK